ncbi:MAG TPA: outer membrane beta-barrel protein [Steroidobacteraceae bacterium]|nr:outer membrane beta-barrel protein [Steroidobacteraceae bacterium]
MLRVRLAAIAGAIACGLMAKALPAYADDVPMSAVTAESRDPNGPASGCARGSESEGFYQRLKESYKTHLEWNGLEPSSPATRVVGGAEVPESNPPWPYSTWNVGGSEAIGVENMYYNALMDALYCGRGGQKLKDSRLTIYGWFEPGANVSTSHTRFNYVTGTGGNYPAAYSFEPNTAQLDQAALYIERTPDEIQRDHFDWGGRFTALYGTDYKYTFANGILSNQYLNGRKQYGFDPVMYYLDFWFPQFAEGENIRVGRYISIPDIEAQLAPNNLTYSHSLLYTYDPYTQNGIVSTTKLNKNWQIQAELSAGNDVAPWVKSERHLTPAACVIWTSDSGNDNVYPCMNGLNDSNWRWNNVQHAVITWYHKFNSKWHMDSELWYMWQSHTPNANNPAGLAAIAQAYSYVNVGAPSGAQCSPTVVYCYSYEWAVLNYLNYQIGPRDTVSWRTDFFNDARGQRTGFKTRYYEFDLGYTHWVGDTIELRPEFRYEHARDVDAYDNPSAIPGAGKNSQAMIAADAIFHF